MRYQVDSGCTHVASLSLLLSPVLPAHFGNALHNLAMPWTIWQCPALLVQVIIVMDPAAAGKPRLPIIRHSTDIKVAPREKRYVFDKAYDGNTDNRTLYNGTVKASWLCCHLSLGIAL